MRFSFLILTVYAVLALAPAYAGSKPDIVVRFGSYCCGIDGATRDKIMTYLRASRYVARVEKSGTIGDEGEYEIYITLNDHLVRDGVYEDIKRLIPKTSSKAPTGIGGPGLETFETQMPEAE